MLTDGVNIDYNKMKYTNIKITNKTKLEDLKLPLLVNNKVYYIVYQKQNK